MIGALIVIIRALTSWLVPSTFEVRSPAYKNLPGALRPVPSVIVRTYELRRGRATEIGMRYHDETVHACPVGSASKTGCCGRIPFELEPGSRMTLDPRLITCKEKS